MSLNRIYYLIAVLLVMPFLTDAQTQDEEEGLEARYSIFGSYNYNQYDAWFENLPEVPSCCPFFVNGKGYGYTFGGGFDFELPYDMLIGLRASFGNLSGDFSTQEETTIRLDDQPQKALFDHIINADLYEIAAEPLLTWKPFGDLEIYAGGHIGFLINKEYVHYERIVSPKDRGVFEDTQSRTRNYSEGEIPQSNSIYGALIVGAGYLYPLNEEKTLFISPELFYTAGMTNIVKDIDWKINTFRAGISIKYFPKELKPEPIKEEPPKEEFRQQLVLDTVIIESEQINKTHLVKGQPALDREEKLVETTRIITEITRRTDTLYKRPIPNVEMEFSTPVINIETHYVTEAFPILPVVFFEENSTKIIDFHNKGKSIEDFSIENLETNPVLFNKEILNIIGQRLKENEDAKVSVKAFADSITENGNCKLALERARTIREYLSNIWKIDKERININVDEENCTPYQPTFSENDSGFAENRRAVIMSDSPEILKPILRERYSEVVDVEPKVIELDPEGTTETGIKEWEIIGVQDGKEIFRKTGSGKPRLVTEEISRYKADALMDGKKLEIIFNVTDVEGKKASEKKSIKIIKDVSEHEVERLSLILFDVSSDLIPEHAKPGVKDLMKSLDDSTKVRIIGYSDVLGPFDFNKELSQNRAKNTELLIKSIAPEANIIERKGVGSLKYPPGIHSYASPTERFLSRTVQIDLIKKVSPEEIENRK